MRTIIISLILLFVFHTVYSQKYSYTDTDIIVCDGDSTYLFKNIFFYIFFFKIYFPIFQLA